MSTKRWLGVAQNVQGVSTWTFANTFAAGDTVDVVCNKKHLILTLGTDVTPTDVAQETAAMINATSATNNLKGATADETRNFGGQEIAEFTEVVASSSGAVLTIKTTAGVPVVIAITVTTAGDGVVGSETVVTAATGKNFFNNADNWSGASLPSAGDTIVLDQGAVDVLYGLNESVTINNLSVIRTSGYTGNIGLLPIHPTLGYVEYRTRYLYLPNSSSNQAFQIGDIDSLRTPTGRTYIDLGAGTTTSLFLEIFDAPPRSTSGYPVQFVRGKKIEFKAHSGGACVGNDETVATNSEFLSFFADGDAKVLMGAYTQMNTGSTVALADQADLVQYGDVADNTVDFTVHSGSLLSYVSFIDALECRGGTTTINNAAVTSAKVYGGAVLQEGNLSATLAALTVYQGATLIHPTNMFAFSSGIDFSGCKPSDIAWTPPDHLTWTPTAI